MAEKSSSSSSSSTESAASPHVLREIFAGCGAGMVATAVGHPLDTIKIHQQVGGKGAMETIKNITKTNGLRGFYRGLLVPMVTNGFFKGEFFSSYASTLSWLTTHRRHRDHIPETAPVLSNYPDDFMAGLTGGFCLAFLVSPVELIKIQMQIDGGKTIKGPLHCLRTIIKTKGYQGLFIGLPATLLRDPHAAGFFMMSDTYLTDLAKLDAHGKQKKIDSLHLFMAGALAGVVFSLVSLPADRIKTQIQGASLQGRTPGILECATKIYKTSGLRGFYKGAFVAVLQAIPTNGALLLSHEYFCMLWDGLFKGLY